jgi:hypothetical protein
LWRRAAIRIEQKKVVSNDIRATRCTDLDQPLKAIRMHEVVTIHDADPSTSSDPERSVTCSRWPSIDAGLNDANSSVIDHHALDDVDA